MLRADFHSTSLEVVCLHEQRAFPITQWRQNMNDLKKKTFIPYLNTRCVFIFFSKAYVANSQKNETEIR